MWHTILSVRVSAAAKPSRGMCDNCTLHDYLRCNSAAPSRGCPAAEPLTVTRFGFCYVKANKLSYLLVPARLFENVSVLAAPDHFATAPADADREGT